MSPPHGPRRWLARRHSIAMEATVVATFYAAYEAARGVVAGTREPALHRAHEIAALERKLHLFEEPSVQRLAGHLPGLVGLLDVAYLTLHLTVTLVLLIWLYNRHPRVFPVVRTTLIIASALSLIGFLIFPTAPPRMAGVGLTDTVSNGAVDLNHGLVSSLYNPYAAFPSMHAGYAFIVGIATAGFARTWRLRIAGVVYPFFVVFVIVATANHFLLDVAAGILVAAAGGTAAWLVNRPGCEAEIVGIGRRHALAADRATRRAAWARPLISDCERGLRRIR
jgi:membrane-associated phospholipid phosphatase